MIAARVRPRLGGRWCRRDCLAVPAGVGDKERHVIGATITELERQLPLEGLDIVDDRLGLYGQLPALSPDHGIPRPQVSRSGQGHLRGPAKTRVETLTQAPQETYVSCVAKGIAGAIRPQGEVESKHLAYGRQVVEGHVPLAALEPPKPRVIDAHRRGHIPQAQACTESDASNVRRNAVQGVACPSPAPIGRSLSRSHDRRSWRSSVNRQLADGSEVLSATPQRTEEPAAPTPGLADLYPALSPAPRAIADWIVWRAQHRLDRPLSSYGQHGWAKADGEVERPGQGVQRDRRGQPDHTRRRGGGSGEQRGQPDRVST